MKKRVILIGLVIVLILTQITPVLAQLEDEKLQTLQDYLRAASLNNADLKASFHRWKAAVEQTPQARSLADPKFTYGYFIEEVETRVGPQRQKFELMQTFPWFGVIETRTDRAAAAAKAAHKKYEAKKLALFEEVKFAFYEFSYLAKAIEITTENLKLLTHFEEIARTKYITAATSHPDIIRAQIELAILEDRLRSLEELRPAITAKLNSILNRPVSSDLPWPKARQYQPVSINSQQLHTMIINHNPQLQAMGYEIQAARSTEVLAKKKSYQSLGVGVSYIDTTHARASGVNDSGKDPVMGMVSLTLPIWSDNYSAAQRQARAKVWQKTNEKTQMQNNLTAKAQQLLYEFEDTARKVKLYGDVIIAKAEEMLATSETAYQAGTIDFLTLIDAQRLLLQYELYYERSIAQNAQKAAKIEMLAGAQLDQIKKKTQVEK